MVVLAKALSGGLVPVGAVLMSDEVCESVYSSLPPLCTRQHSAKIREQLTTALEEFEMVKEVRGMGLLMGIEFQAASQLQLASSP